jgi:hypothetical protein
VQNHPENDLHYYINQVRKQPRNLKGTSVVFYDFDQGQVCLATDHMDFASSDAHPFLHKNWDVDAHLHEQKIGIFLFFSLPSSFLFSKNGQMVQKFTEITSEAQATRKGQKLIICDIRICFLEGGDQTNPQTQRLKDKSSQ